MEIYTVSLFGHRDIYNLREIDKPLSTIVEDLIRQKSYVNFLIGRMGDFDEYAASIIKGAQRLHGKDNNELTLVLPYKISNIEYYEDYYDSITIPECTVKAHPTRALILKNRFMVESSDLVIVYVTKNEGGAYLAMKYAENLGKTIINLAKRESDDE